MVFLTGERRAWVHLTSAFGYRAMILGASLFGIGITLLIPMPSRVRTVLVSCTIVSAVAFALLISSALTRT